MTRDAGAPVRERRGGTALAVAYFLPPLAALLQLQIAYMNVPLACRYGTAALHVVSALALFAVLGGVLAGWRVWREAGGGWDAAGADPLARTRFLAVTAMQLGVLFALVSVAMWLPILFLDPCV